MVQRIPRARSGSDTYHDRTLLHGGIFTYPSDNKSPKGYKLRILYKCAPWFSKMQIGSLFMYRRNLNVLR